jgi:hypothetical protein
VSSDQPDGTLRHWDDIAEQEDWQILLLGNGLSMNVWPSFGYRSLLDYASQAELTQTDRALFAGGTNFEAVLSDLIREGRPSPPDSACRNQGDGHRTRARAHKAKTVAVKSV